jgi:hypothetical protein
MVNFCDAFEVCFNEAVDTHMITDVDIRIFQKLFDKVVWYSPYPDERARVPNYVSEDEILSMAKQVLEEFKAS